ncbi:hypothetical protein JCM10207_006241 [Rhodosporidiobolus poonsookiae]
MKGDLTIVSYNIRRSPRILDTLLNTVTGPAAPPVDLLLLQEPPRTLPPLPRGWSALFPPPLPLPRPDDEPTVPRSVAMVAPSLAGAVEQVVVASRDVVAAGLRTEGGSVRVVGVYNPAAGALFANRSVETVLPPLLAASDATRPLLVAGDFNLCHPSWDPDVARETSDAEEDAKLTFDDAGLVLLRPPGAPTWCGGKHESKRETLDLVLGNLRAEALLVSADVDKVLECHSDHRPLRVVLQTALSPPPPPLARRNWKKYDKEEGRKTYEEVLSSLPSPAALSSVAEIDAEAASLHAAVSAAAETAPLRRPGPSRFANAWWTEEVAAASAMARTARNRLYRLRRAGRVTEGAERAWRTTRNRFEALKRREKKRAEQEEVERVRPETVWRYAKKRMGGEGVERKTTPPLVRQDGSHAVTTAEKRALLQPILLPVMRDAAEEEEGADHSATGGPAEGRGEEVSPPSWCISRVEGGPPLSKTSRDARQQSSLSPLAVPFVPATPLPSPPPPPPPELDWPDLQEDELASALSSTRPLAAAGPDGVPNLILQSLWPTLRGRLVPLFAACLRLGYTPAAWRDATGVVLSKPNKPDYSSPKAYRMIVFARSLAKLLELVVARRLSYLADAHELLPVLHIGGRRGRSAEDAVACFVDAIKRQWRHGNVVVGMALDVAQAFPSVRTARLVRNLKEKGLPDEVGRFVEAFMSDRSCRLRVDGEEGEEVAWGSGLPQGSPLSPILFLFYNAGAVEACASASSTGCGWIDDLNLLAWGRTVDEAVSVLQARVPALEKWSKTHQSAFEPAKTKLTLFIPRQRRRPASLPPVTLCGVELEWSPTLTMLGAVLDGELSFKAHIACCAAKASTAVTAVRLLASAGKGLSPREVRTVVEAVVVPRALWMAEIWFDPATRTVSKVLEAVQRRALLAITSAYRTTSLAALQVEANSPPLDLVARRRTFRLALRALSATPTHPLYAPRRLAQARRPKAHPSPIHRALAAFPSILSPSLTVEPIIPLPLPPWEPEPAAHVVIAASKEEARLTHNTLLAALPASHLVAYLDGSLLDGRAGAGVLLRAVLGEQESELERGRAMGQYQSVYAAELEGARLALATSLPLVPAGFRAILLALNNQSVLLQPFSPAPSAGQSLRLALRSLARHLNETNPECMLTLLWVPGHVGVDGNERADELAKAAAESRDEGDEAVELATRRRHRHGRTGRVFRASVEEWSDLSSVWSEYSGGEMHEGETMV